MIITYVLGLFVGVVLGLTGAGGGIIAIPVLMYGFQWDLITAGPVALIAIGFSAWVGAFYARKQGYLNIKAALLMAFAGMPMTPIGQWIAKSIPYSLLLIFFILVVCVVAIRMWLSSFRRLSTPINTDQNHSPALVIFIVIGLISGLMTGLLSVGGGFIIVPLLTQLAKFNIKQASSTSLLVIAIISTSGIITSVGMGASLPMPLTLYFTLTVVIGLFLGRIFTAKLPDYIVLRLFALVLIGIASLMLYQHFVTR